MPAGTAVMPATLDIPATPGTAAIPGTAAPAGIVAMPYGTRGWLKQGKTNHQYGHKERWQFMYLKIRVLLCGLIQSLLSQFPIDGCQNIAQTVYDKQHYKQRNSTH